MGRDSPLQSGNDGEREIGSAVSLRSATSSKKPRGEEQRGERRPAETDLEALEYDTLHAALLDPEPEIIAGQPTLHETPLVAHLAGIMPTGYPDWANYDGAVDERTGEPLPEDKVKKGRGRELLKMESHNVKTGITWKQAKDMGLKIVKSRWVDYFRTIRMEFAPDA